jgi:predicted metal-dependent phosphoesterase TrpH
MSQEELDELVAEGVIESVVPDPETAQIELEQAQLHVESAAEIAERDPVAAFAIGYDAIRKARSRRTCAAAATESREAQATTRAQGATRSPRSMTLAWKSTWRPSTSFVNYETNPSTTRCCWTRTT